MKKNRISILFTLSALMLMSFVHEYFVSVTNISYNKQSQELEYSIKFIAHDLEKAILTDYNHNLKLEETTPLNDSLLKQYVQEHFKIANITTPINYIGYEFLLDETCYVYFTQKANKLPSSITIHNTLLVDAFPAQENLTHVTLPHKQLSYSFRKNKDAYTFQLHDE